MLSAIWLVPPGRYWRKVSVRAQQQKRRRLDPGQTNQFSSGMLLAFIKSIFLRFVRIAQQQELP
jgi:hypothetical protein